MKRRIEPVRVPIKVLRRREIESEVKDYSGRRKLSSAADAALMNVWNALIRVQKSRMDSCDGVRWPVSQPRSVLSGSSSVAASSGPVMLAWARKVLIARTKIAGFTLRGEGNRIGWESVVG